MRAVPTRLLVGGLLLVPLILLLWFGASRPFWSWWQTPDQRAQQLLAAGEPGRAARLFSTPERQAFAHYQAGEFAAAERLWARLLGPGAAFNRGAALAQLQRYDAAADQYRQALAQRPEWAEARDNLALVELLARQPATPSGDDQGGTHSADGVVMDERADGDAPRYRSAGEGGAAEGLSGEQRKALWLRRLDASPAQFLRIKFSRQWQRRQEQRP